jgi:hypothetical protein
MALDQASRNLLRKAVQQIREILARDLAETLEGTYGVHRRGVFERLEALPSLSEHGRETRELLERLLLPAPTSNAQSKRFEEGFDSALRSLAFTHLNRLVAFKLMEDPSRKVLKETVGRGAESRAFKFYLADHPGDEAVWKSGRQDEAYRHFLLWQCAQLNQEIGVLFDPDDLASRVFPRATALAAVLAALNDSELAPVWTHEEAIGWIYQYYTPKELREKARKESGSPRSSYEMAFRNQFYTPEYVVRFLVDNTLGRLWYDMRGGDTALAERCEYLVLRPGETPLPRATKDPREIRVLDPACGSGHFLVYAFDLFEVIYREAYDDAAGAELREEWPDRARFESAIPGLIVEHNLHGIDIDRRAVQLAALTLFLKARSRSPHALIETSNLVCAEPMPGEQGLYEDFKQRELLELPSGQAVMARILDDLRDHLMLAAEAGSLLQAEREIERLVAREHEEWRSLREPGTQYVLLFPELPGPRQAHLDFENVTDEEFWQGLEASVERLFRKYAKEATGAEGAHRRLFARDGIEVLRFVEALRRRYDVVLMNPPFGKPSLRSKTYIDATYPRTRNDVYAAFVERWLARLLEHGRLGAITSRTGFFLKTFTRWREEVLLGQAQIDAVADLGHGVLDTAMVETAAYVLEKRPVGSADPC